MKRRRFISSMTIAFTGVAVGSQCIFSSCEADITASYFTEEDILLLDEIGETIIPATNNSPGAKAAKIGEFMNVYVSDCYTLNDQEVFRNGLSTFRKYCFKKFKNDFFKLSLSQKKEILSDLDKQAADHTKARQQRRTESTHSKALQTGKTGSDKIQLLQNSDHYFTMLRNLTLLGYFTSEPGATKALRYLQTPGYYSGEVPYNTGDKSWAI